MRGWKFVGSEDVKKAGGADHHNLEMRVSEYLLAEYEDPKAWTQPVRDLPVYRLIQSTLAVMIMGSLMRMFNPTSSVVEHPKTSTGAAKAMDSGTKAPSTCSVEAVANQGGRSNRKSPSMSLSLTPDFLIENIKGPQYEGQGGLKLRRYIINAPLGFDDPGSSNDSAAVRFCKRTLIDYLTVASRTFAQQRTLKADTRRHAGLKALALDGAPVGDAEGVLFRVDEGHPVAEALSNLHDLATTSDQSCRLTLREESQAESDVPVAAIDSRTSDNVVVSLEYLRGATAEAPVSRDVTAELMQSRFNSAVSPAFTCPARLADILQRAWMAKTSDSGILAKHVAAKIEAEFREGKWNALTDGNYQVRTPSLAAYIMATYTNPLLGRKPTDTKTLPESLDSCIIETVEMRQAGETVPRYSLTLKSDFSMYKIGLPDSTIDNPDELNILWRRIRGGVSRTQLTQRGMMLVDICRRTLLGYLIAGQESETGSPHGGPLTWKYLDILGGAEVEPGSIKFRVAVESVIGNSVVAFARM
ncbi:hypothetical protein FOZ63_005386, partial [Perkinsus olseni]